MVENSLLHALRGNERGYMKVRARRIGDKVNLRVIDNGDGMTREELEALRKRIADRNSRSIGLTNLDRRLRLRYQPVVLHPVQKIYPGCPANG